ncbi:MAG: hypothetical protein UX81_C0004G0017 [Parcubacteria group bacterium GW2011_GWA2_47_12]|nr:MAG: hypothetical protein UX81_C0004G0017 [Parcubacteria group bacterium GW2011_GWA2_47_12]
MNKIIITSFHPFVSRNILSAPFYEMLKHTGWRIMLLVPERKKEFFEREYGGIGVAVEAMPNLLSRADGIFRELAMAAIRTRSLAIMRKRGMGIFHPLLQRFFFFAPLIRSLIPFLYGYFMYTSAYRALLKKYNPSVVFATDVFSSNDCRLLLEAKRLRIPTVGMVRSWDSLTTKGGFRVIPDTLIMNNNLVKEEAMRLHGISASRIRVVGIPHYDRYLSPPARTRAEILSALGVPTDKRLALYVPLGDRIVKVGERALTHTFDRDIIALIARLLPPSHTLLVRLPPTDTVNLEELPLLKNVVFDQPGTRFGDGIGGRRIAEMTRAEDVRLHETIFATDFVLTVFSSVCIDAVVMGKPVILIGFDPVPVSYWESVSRIHEFEHIRPVLQSGGVATVRSESELQNALISCARKPAADTEKRRALAEWETYALDGKSSKRMLEVVLGALKS